jgi:acetyltransferase-like isoleucine patch superfamily enzyme
VPESAIVFGVPARVVGKRSETDSAQVPTAADKNP